MVNVDIRTRVELKNETQRMKAQRGTAGKVALIGAFPSSKQKVFAAESFAQIVNHYGVKLNSKSEFWYNGVRAAKRIFMEGINGYAGASSITCVNICHLKPKFNEEVIAPLYAETYSEDGLEYDPVTGVIQTNNVTINHTDKYTITDDTIKQDTSLSFDKLDKALKQIADEDMDMLFISNDLWEIFDNPLSELDDNGNQIYGKTVKRDIHNIGDVYDYILDFVDNEFTNHRPVNYIGAIKTRATPEGSENNVSSLGIGSNIIRVNGTKFDLDNEENNPNYNKYVPSAENPYADVLEWGAVDIANLFTRTTNELSTCGLFYQGGIVAGEEVDSMELAAHICGWICSLPITQDLTYQTIPALTAVDEEPFLGKYDAGRILNEAGIQIIRPKSRLDKTFYVNNSIMPTGWHTNHIRCVTYLLKRLQFESGLGINNYVTNVEAYRASLETVAKEVMSECDIIRDVSIGDVEVLSHYHVYVPISIVLAGVVTLINIGVSMALDETGTWGTYIKTTSGYSMDV